MTGTVFDIIVHEKLRDNNIRSANRNKFRLLKANMTAATSSAFPDINNNNGKKQHIPVAFNNITFSKTRNDDDDTGLRLLNEQILHQNIVIKKPFKHYNKPQTNVKPVNPAADLIKKTNEVNSQFLFKYEIERKLASNSAGSFRMPPRRTPLHVNLKPLNRVNLNGPGMGNCIGILKEPVKKTVQIREIYEKKLQMLTERQQRLAEYQNGKEHAERENPLREKSFEMSNLLESAYDFETS